MLGGFRRPPWWAILLTVAAALLFVRLGFWQLHRADYKDELLRRYATAAVAPAQDFAEVARRPPSDAYPRVRVQGRYLADRVYLLDNPKHDDRGGVEVYVPLRVPDSDRLLLADLGFLPGNGSGETPQLPPLPEGVQSLHGLYLPPPGHGFEMGGDALTGPVARDDTEAVRRHLAALAALPDRHLVDGYRALSARAAVQSGASRELHELLEEYA